MAGPCSFTVRARRLKRITQHEQHRSLAPEAMKYSIAADYANARGFGWMSGVSISATSSSMRGISLEMAELNTPLSRGVVKGLQGLCFGIAALGSFDAAQRSPSEIGLRFLLSLPNCPFRVPTAGKG